jgi:hypothetical protein
LIDQGSYRKSSIRPVFLFAMAKVR